MVPVGLTTRLIGGVDVFHGYRLRLELWVRTGHGLRSSEAVNYLYF